MKEVSVVIPSYKRHEEVVRAVRSALDQTQPPLEVIVSNDGPDPVKARLLSAIGDGRVRYVEAPRKGCASATRNFGVQHAIGNWIALLDDDDIWLPGKLEAQFSALEKSGLSEAILAAVEVVYDRGNRSYVRPAGDVPVGINSSEFLFCGYGGANTSTIVAPRWSFERLPFDETLERHEDWSWLLHAGEHLKLVVALEEVCERHLIPGGGLSRPGGYQFSRNWYEQHSGLMTRRARAAFVSGLLSRKAAYDLAPKELGWIVAEIGRQRGLTPVNVARLLTPWIMPAKVRMAIKNIGTRK